MDRRAPVLRLLRGSCRASIGIFVVSVAVVLGGCNVFEGFAPTPTTVDALVNDAEAALASGNAARAVELYERAFEKDSTDVRVRVGLGNALYADRGLDVFTLRRAAEHLVDSGEASAAPAGRHVDSREAVCTDGLRPSNSRRYDAVASDAAPIRELTEHASVIERVYRLVVNGILGNADRGFASAAPGVRRTGFLVGTVTVVAYGVVEVDRVLRRTEGTLFVDSEFESGAALVACASSKADRSRNHRALCRLGDAARRGEHWLQARTEGADEAKSSVLSERVRTLDDVIRARINCS